MAEKGHDETSSGRLCERSCEARPCLPTTEKPAHSVLLGKEPEHQPSLECPILDAIDGGKASAAFRV